MMFIKTFVFFLGVFATLFLGWAALVGLPDMMISEIQPPEGLQRYTAEQLYGRRIYVREGCVYCHSQQVRPTGFGADQARYWGRPSVPADYVYDKPHLLGTMRTGPDLTNIGGRQTSENWHLTHLYNPRLVTPGSIMPPFPWLFELRMSPGPTDKVISLPDSIARQGLTVVAGPEANALVAYLLGMNRSYPVAQVLVDSANGRR